MARLLSYVSGRARGGLLGDQARLDRREKMGEEILARIEVSKRLGIGGNGKLQFVKERQSGECKPRAAHGLPRCAAIPGINDLQTWPGRVPRAAMNHPDRVLGPIRIANAKLLALV